MNNRKEIKSPSMEYSDAGLGLKMPAESSEFEKTMSAFPFNQYQFDSTGNSTSFTPSTSGGGRGGGPFLWDFSSIQARGTEEIYAAGTAGLPTIRFRASGGGGGGGVAVSEASLFTAVQLHELERQQRIHKYMMASIPVPHELVSPISRTSLSLAGGPQPKTSGSGVDSRFSSASKLDPEPWRCRRTDGKKWRCSRNAATDQRYCERHSHKNKPRSRKHVEPLQAPPTSQVPSMAPGHGAVPYDQARRIEWSTRGGSSGTAIHVSTCNYRQQMQQPSSRLDLMDRDNAHHHKNVCLSQTLHGQEFKAPVPNRFEFSHGEYRYSLLPSRITTSFQGNLSLNPNRTHTTPPPHFIHAWEQEGIKGLSPSSLTLSMSLNPNVEGNENDHSFGVGINDSERPGGPLGEALCLGNASSSNLLSPNDYTYTSNSCEDGSHAFKFIR